ncbi:hypothetical protein K505DRAFT_406031 [Melanomma pulvis-pyrius CBS 109.77]|uniref:Uncharacterized protein n=1 Tax=Melanomma pulvis-pyrius CBS 109.77 TaxID=1314802 RepID=A0A6A6XKB3_9PLEO|nr:hypothetical protein K505DRAFT_406031 [Melanomma pulvis-pyrius CBS 109.77]
MGRWQPYLYNAPQRESVMDVPDQFNPKAITMASRQPPSLKKKVEGPLMNLNQHPDSYLILPYGRTDAKPMGPKVKVVVNTVRWIQLFFRVLALFGAVGVLLCTIFIRGAQDTEGYLMRIPPSIDLAVILYAIYHLLRAAKARPAASSASYHFFALVMDAGFIPFYVFTALLAKRNSDEEAGTIGRWRTFFPTDEETDKVLKTTWLTAVAVAGLHCIALALDLYLVLIFRKIARLPPDMNPLEDNLTSRRKTKHKHKNSSMSAITPLTAEEKRFSAQSGTMSMIGNRNSQADPLMAGKDIPAPDANNMAFMHTRTNSDMVYSPHTPKSAHQSRQSLYSAPASARQSRGDLHTRDDLHRRGEEDDGETLAQRKAFLAQKAIKRSSRPHSFVSSKQDFYTPPTTAENHDASGDLSLPGGHSDNWFVHDEDPVGPPRHSGERTNGSNGAYASLSYPPEEYPAAKQSMFTPKKGQGYNSLSTSEDLMSDDELEPPMLPQPLRMNPPTPPPMKSFHEARSTPPPPMLQRTHTTTSMSTDSTFSRSPTRTGTPKSRYYGDLKAATSGIKNGSYSPAQSPSSSPTKGAFTPNHLPSAARQYTTNAPSTAKAYVTNSLTKKYISNSPMTLDKKSYASVRRTGEAGYTPVQNESPRIVSRTGVDYEGNGDYDYDDVSDLGSGRRDVSGKIAEEGRGGVANLAGRWGGMRGSGLTYRKVSGVA